MYLYCYVDFRSTVQMLQYPNMTDGTCSGHVCDDSSHLLVSVQLLMLINYYAKWLAAFNVYFVFCIN